MIKILGARVIVESDKAIEKTASGLVISKTTDQSDFSKGKVVYAGNGRMMDNGIIQSMEVKVGDNIIFQYGTMIQLEGKSYLLVNESDVIAII
jgi:chaperonin GroES